MAYSPRPERLLPDSWDQDQHQSLKRWERFAQRTAWKARGKEALAPPLPCYWREPAHPFDPAAALEAGPAHLLALFAGDLALVRFTGHLESVAGVRVLRGGIPWAQWTPVILRAWIAGAAVPAPFRPRRRLPALWLEQALAAGPSDQKIFFDRLREAGILSPLVKISAEGVTPWLRWEDVRERFIDFAPAVP
jgi:hypothetical protein